MKWQAPCLLPSLILASEPIDYVSALATQVFSPRTDLHMKIFDRLPYPDLMRMEGVSKGMHALLTKYLGTSGRMTFEKLLEDLYERGIQKKDQDCFEELLGTFMDAPVREKNLATFKKYQKALITNNKLKGHIRFSKSFPTLFKYLRKYTLDRDQYILDIQPEWIDFTLGDWTVKLTEWRLQASVSHPATTIALAKRIAPLPPKMQQILQDPSFASILNKGAGLTSSEMYLVLAMTTDSNLPSTLKILSAYSGWPGLVEFLPVILRYCPWDVAVLVLENCPLDEPARRRLILQATALNRPPQLYSALRGSKLIDYCKDYYAGFDWSESMALKMRGAINSYAWPAGITSDLMVEFGIRYGLFGEAMECLLPLASANSRVYFILLAAAKNLPQEFINKIHVTLSSKVSFDCESEDIQASAKTDLALVEAKTGEKSLLKLEMSPQTLDYVQSVYCQHHKRVHSLTAGRTLMVHSLPSRLLKPSLIFPLLQESKRNLSSKGADIIHYISVLGRRAEKPLDEIAAVALLGLQLGLDLDPNSQHWQNGEVEMVREALNRNLDALLTTISRLGSKFNLFAYLSGAYSHFFDPIISEAILDLCRKSAESGVGREILAVSLQSSVLIQEALQSQTEGYMQALMTLARLPFFVDDAPWLLFIQAAKKNNSLENILQAYQIFSDAANGSTHDEQITAFCQLQSGMELALDMLSTLPSELVRKVLTGAPALTTLLVEDQGCTMMLSELGLIHHALTVLQPESPERVTNSYSALVPYLPSDPAELSTLLTTIRQ